MTELPANWSWVTLNDLQADEPRAITDGPFGSNLTSAHYSDSGARVIRLQNIGDGRFIDAEAFVPMSHFEKLKGHEARAGDLIVASLGDNLPRACLVPPNLGPAIVKADCIRVRLGDHVEPRWALYAMQTPQVRRWAADQLHGVGRLRLGLKGIRKLPVPLPSIEEQRRVLDVLEDHLTRLDAAEAALRQADARTASVVRAGVTWGIRTAQGAGPGLLVNDIAKVVDCEHRTAKVAPVGGEYGYSIRTTDLRAGVILTDRAKRVTEETYVQFTRRATPRIGDLIFSREAPVGQVGRVTHDLPLCLGQRTVLLQPDRELIRPEYLMYALLGLDAQRWMSDNSTGTTVLHLNVSDVRQIPLGPLPTLHEQDRVITALDDLAAASARLARSVTRQVDRNASLRMAILTAAFSGRLASTVHPQEFAHA